MIRFDHVSKQYSGTTRPALNAINLEVLRGEFVFLVGASGSGKSSCLRLILKEEKATKGKIHVLGQDVGAISNRKVPYFRRNIGVVFQDFRLLPNKSVFDNVAFTLQVIGKSRGFIQEAVPDVLKMVGLSGKASRLPHELSGGEQQRVAIARAVVNKPQVLLADEPTGNLDPATSAGIMAVLERINAGGTTVLMATHEAGIVDQMQRRVVELVSGQIVRDERHGGYGFTAAIPTTHGAMADASGDSVTRNTAPFRLAGHVVPDLHAAELSAEAAAAAPPVLVPTRAVDLPPVQVVPEPAAPEQYVPVPAEQAGPAHAAQVPIEPTTETARLSAHFAAPPTQPVIRTQPLPDEELPEQLSLAEKLGLRAPGDDQDITGEQNVGPTK